MNLDNLRRQVRDGDKAAARVLLRRARADENVDDLLLGWRLVHPLRYNAWQAFKAVLKAGNENIGRDKNNLETQLMKSEIAARVLIESCVFKLRDAPDPMCQALLDLSTRLLDDESVRGVLDDSAGLENLQNRAIAALFEGPDAVAAVLS